jgi:hypothetical protein
MAIRYPRFVTRQSLAALITLLLLAFLAVALIFPWYAHRALVASPTIVNLHFN